MLAHPVPGGPRSLLSRSRPAFWLSAILLVYLLHVVYLNCVAEDAYIAFRFARNLASGYGLVWNPGEVPVEGYTNFLWVMLCAGAMKLGLDVPRFSQVAGTLAGAATILLVYAAGRSLLRWPDRLALIPALMLAVAGPFATWAGGGMETTLFTMLVMAALYAFAAYWETGRRALVVWMALALVAATLTRPEGLMVFCLLMGLSVLLSLGEGRGRALDLLGAGLTFAVPFGIYFAWRSAYYGFLLPNTFYAKTGGGLDQLLRGVMLTAQFGQQFVFPLVPWALVALWETGVATARPERAGLLLTALRRHALVTGACLILVVYTAYIVAVGDDYMAMHRFFVPLLPPLYLVATTALAPLAAPLTSRRSRRPVFAVLVALAAAATAFHSTRFEKHFFAKPAQQHGNYQGVQIERWHAARLSLIGQFFNKYRKASAESLATNAIGAVGYYADMLIYDFHGLVDLHIARMPVPPNKLKGRAGHQKSDYPYVLAKRPTYLMFSRELGREPTDLRRYVSADVWPLIERDYEVRSVWLTDAANHEAGYFSFLERRSAPAS